VTRMMKLWWSVTAAVVVLGVAGVTTGVAAAQKDEPSTKLTVDRVDARGDEVVVSGSLTGADPSTIEVSVDGKPVEPTSAAKLAEGGGRNEVIVVIDNAEGLGNATVQLAKAGISHLMPSEGATSTLGVISTGGKVVVEAGPSANEATIMAGLEGIHPVGTSFTWDGVARAANLLEERSPNTTGTVVLFTASPSSPTGAPATVASSALQRAGVRLDVIALPKGVDVGTVGEMVAERGGTLDLIDSDEDLDGAFAKIASGLEGRFELTFPAEQEPGSILPLTLKSGSTTAELSFTPGAVRTGSFGLAPITEDASGGFFSSSLVKWAGLILGVIAVMLILWTVLTMVLPSENDLVSRLEVYEETYGKEEESADLPDAGQATVPIIRRAVELTGEMAERRGLLDKLETKLERANLPLRAAEAMFFSSAATLILVVLTFVLTGNLFMTLVAGGLAVVVPLALLEMRIRKRRKAFVSQLPDMLTLLAGTLKAGYSVAQGFESVSTEIDEPMGRELRRVVTETRLGRPLEEALEAVAERMGSDDFAWAVMAIRIQREVGGNLAELLTTVADTMTQRERLRREVSTLTAEGRLSAIIIGLLPPGLAGALAVLNPEYIGSLFEPGIGYALLGAAIVMMFIGFAWMKKTITIEV